MSLETEGSPTFDQGIAEAFAERFLNALNDGALCLMISMGHRTGLLDTMHGMPPSTSHEIAAEADLDERYVREWLGAMVVSGVVTVSTDSTHFALPDEHAAFLTRAAGSDNIAVFAQYIAELGSVEDRIVECFHKGGGVPYEEFNRFHEIMAEDSGQSVLSSLESHILPLVAGLHERLQEGILVLDLGCGSGRAVNQLASMYPKSSFHGFDLSDQAIAVARRESQQADLTNTTFIIRDLSDFDQTAEPNRYDLVTTFDAVHDQARPMSLLKGIRRTLRDDGVYLMQDIKGSSHVHNNLEHPIGTLLYTISCMHCMTVSLAQGGEGLGAMWGEEKTYDYLKAAGFSSIVTNELDHDIQNNWYVVRK